MVGLIIAVVCILAVAIPSYFLVRSTLKNAPLVRAAKERFRAEVGYEFDGPMNLVVLEDGRRELASGTLVFHSEKRQEGNRIVTEQTFRLLLPSSQRRGFRIVSRHLVGGHQMLTNLLSSTSLRLGAASYPAVLTGDPLLDQRFAVYAEDPAYAAHALRDPAVIRALTPFASVILDVTREGVTFADPADANMWAVYDARGFSRLSNNPVPLIESAAQVHLAVHALLAETARATAAMDARLVA